MIMIYWRPLVYIYTSLTRVYLDKTQFMSTVYYNNMKINYCAMTIVTKHSFFVL